VLPEARAVVLNASAVPAVFELALDCTVALPTSVCGAAAAATVNDCVAGVASVLPAASVARTAMPCMPSVRAPVVHGLVHAVQAPASSRHRNVEPLSLAVNPNVGVLSVVVPVGPDVIVVFGAVVSAGGGVLPAAATVIAFIVVAMSPSTSVTLTRTFLMPASRNVKAIVLPLPSGHCWPAAPSPPSSCQV
jgi:hypothetical protein